MTQARTNLVSMSGMEYETVAAGQTAWKVTTGAGSSVIAIGNFT